MDCTECQRDPRERGRRYRKAWIGLIDSGVLRAIAIDDLNASAGMNLANAERKMGPRPTNHLRAPTRLFSEQEGSEESWHAGVDPLEML